MDAHPEAGGAGVQMLNVDGTCALESRRALPTPWVSFMKMMGSTERYYMSHLSWDSPQQIEIISGAFCLLRRKALDQIGLLDETFFMYGEDIDMSYRLLKGGWQNWYLPLQILHYKGESTEKTSFRYVHVFYQAMLIFFRKHYGHLSLLITLPIKAAIYFKAFTAFVQMQFHRLSRAMGNAEKCHPELMVLDTADHSYEEILRLLSNQQEPRKTLGIRNSKTGILITPYEILQ
jgi:GT2 family glycosyltransferase